MMEESQCGSGRSRTTCQALSLEVADQEAEEGTEADMEAEETTKEVKAEEHFSWINK